DPHSLHLAQCLRRRPNRTLRDVLGLGGSRMDGVFHAALLLGRFCYREGDRHLMKAMLSRLITITIVALTARPSIVLTLTMFCAGSVAANRPEFQNPAPVQQPTASPVRGQAVDAKPEGDWEGSLDASPLKLRIVLHLTRKEGAYSGM